MQTSTTFYEKLNTLPTIDDMKYLIGSYLYHYEIINNKAVFNGVKDLKTFNKIYDYIKSHFYYVIINRNINSEGNLKYPSDIYDVSDYYIKYNQKIHTMTRDCIINLIETSTSYNNNLKTIRFLMNNYNENDEPCKYVEFIDAAAEKGNYDIIKYFLNKGGDAYPLYDTDFSDCSIKYLKSLFNLINDGFVNLPNIAFILDKELCNRITGNKIFIKYDLIKIDVEDEEDIDYDIDVEEINEEVIDDVGIDFTDEDIYDKDIDEDLILRLKELLN